MTAAWGEDLINVVSDDLRFKAKLGIGEDAYLSSRIRNTVFEAWDIAGAATTGAQVASSAMVAQKFFAAPGILAALGIGSATAVTPVGWVILAGVISGGAWFGITRYAKGIGGRSVVIPSFINTPMDVLGLGLFDLMAPLAVKVAAADQNIHQNEHNRIVQYFVQEWGLSTEFVDQGLSYVSERIDTFDVQNAADMLVTFARENPDCNAEHILQHFQTLLTEIMEADHRIDPREERAINEITAAFQTGMQSSIRKRIVPIGQAASKLASGAKARFRAVTPKRKPGTGEDQ